MGQGFVRSLWGAASIVTIVLTISACDVSDNPSEPEVTLTPNSTANWLRKVLHAGVSLSKVAN